MSAGRHGPQAVLEITAHLRQRPAGLAVKAAPKREHLEFSGVRAGQAQGALDGLGTAGEELHFVELRREQLREQLERLEARLGREGADVDLGQLRTELGQVARMRVTESGDRDTRDEIEETIAVHVEQLAAHAGLDGDARVFPDRLRARREVLELFRAKRT